MNIYNDAGFIFIWLPMIMLAILAAIHNFIQRKFYKVVSHVAGHTEVSYQGKGKAIPIISKIVIILASLLLTEIIFYLLIGRLIIN